MIRKIRPLAFIVLAMAILTLVGQALFTDIFYGSHTDESGIPGDKAPFIESAGKYEQKVKEFGLETNSSNTFQNTTDNDIVKAMDFLKNKLSSFSWDEFNYENDYIFAQFVPSELENPKALLWIDLPKNMSFSYKNHTAGFEVNLNCADSKSVVLDTFMENIKEINIPAAQLLRNGGYTLITKCANIDCNEVGPVCLLLPFGSESEAKVYDFN
jgi:hypothetical protein